MDKKTIIIISVAVILFIIILFVVYKMGKKNSNPSTAKIPKKLVGDLSEEEVEKMRKIAIAVHNDMDGINFSWKTDLYFGIMNLSQRNLMGLNNIFNELYQADSGQSFSQWLQNENFNTPEQQIYVGTILDKLAIGSAVN